jgi:hypothetical protein
MPELQHLVLFSSDNETLRLLHVDLLRELPIKEHNLHVHVIDLLAFICSEGQDEAHIFHSCHQREHFYKVGAGLLNIALCNKAGHVLDHHTGFILLLLEHPAESNCMMPTWQLSELTSVFFFDRRNLFSHHRSPCLILIHLYK